MTAAKLTSLVLEGSSVFCEFLGFRRVSFERIKTADDLLSAVSARY